MTWEWANNDIFFIFDWSIPLILKCGGVFGECSAGFVVCMRAEAGGTLCGVERWVCEFDLLHCLPSSHSALQWEVINSSSGWLSAFVCVSLQLLRDSFDISACRGQTLTLSLTFAYTHTHIHTHTDTHYASLAVLCSTLYRSAFPAHTGACVGVYLCLSLHLFFFKHSIFITLRC